MGQLAWAHYGTSQLSALVVPPALRPGDKIRIIAPSSPFDRALFFRGIGWLSQRYRVEVAEHALARRGFLAGSDEQRLSDLNLALESKQIQAIVAARGGHGAVRIVHQANWQALREHPKWLVGFSDVTLLHLEAFRVGVSSLHAENAAGLGRADTLARNAWVAALEAPTEPCTLRGNQVIRAGAGQGCLFGGNLTMVFTALATGRYTIPEGAILFLEDVAESSYRIDRMLTTLAVSGALKAVRGVALGDFTDCPPGPHGVPVADVLRDCLQDLTVPVVSGFCFGHGQHNVPLRLGRHAKLDSGSLSLTLE